MQFEEANFYKSLYDNNVFEKISDIKSGLKKAYWREEN